VYVPGHSWLLCTRNHFSWLPPSNHPRNVPRVCRKFVQLAVTYIGTSIRSTLALRSSQYAFHNGYRSHMVCKSSALASPGVLWVIRNWKNSGFGIPMLEREESTSAHCIIVIQIAPSFPRSKTSQMRGPLSANKPLCL
jgi:hypothetical protein